MPWTGPNFIRRNEDYTGASVWQTDRDNAIKILAVRHDYHDFDLANGIDATINKNGANSPTANINWGGFKITNAAYGGADKEMATYGQTVTAIAINSSTKILTLTRTQGDLTVDLTPIVVAGDTSDFARLSLANAYNGTNTFNQNVFAVGDIYLTPGGFAGYRFKRTAASAPLTNGMEIVGLGSASGVNFALGFDGSSVAQAYLSGVKLLKTTDFDPTGYLKPSDSTNISGSWSFSLPVQIGTSWTLAGSGYSWTATVAGPNTFQLAGTGGAFLKVESDKLTVNGNVIWGHDHMSVVTAVPTGGTNDDIAFVTTGTDKGVWARVAGTWTKIAS